MGFYPAERIILHVATCLGCGTRTRAPRAKNWKDHQLCYKCYCKKFKKKPGHGTGGKYLKPLPAASLIETTYDQNNLKEVEAIIPNETHR